MSAGRDTIDRVAVLVAATATAHDDTGTRTTAHAVRYSATVHALAIAIGINERVIRDAVDATYPWGYAVVRDAVARAIEVAVDVTDRAIR